MPVPEDAPAPPVSHKWNGKPSHRWAYLAADGRVNFYVDRWDATAERRKQFSPVMIEPHYPKRGRGRPPYPLRPLLRLYLLRQWFALSDQAAQEIATDSMAVREFMGLGLVWGGAGGAAPDESTILNFRRLMDKHGLAAQITADIADRLNRQGWKIRPGEIAEAGIVARRQVGA